MAEGILFNVAQSLLQNVGSGALVEIAASLGFTANIEKLKNSINTIKDVLLDAEERQVGSHAVRGWLDRLKTAMYAADDLFDELATVALQREVMGGGNWSAEVLTFFSHSNQIARASNTSKKIKKIREDLDEIVKDSSEFAFILRPHEEGRLPRRVRDQTHSFVDVEEVIGREDDKEAIIRTLMASCSAREQQPSVIAIVGMGGLGKTTLAQLIYNDKRVENQFELKLWVCVSEVFDIQEVTKKILMSATNNESKNLEMDQLQGQLRKEIGGRKYVLVLDDVWNEKSEEWRSLRAILKVGGEGSKILVTTRSRTVADIMRTVPAYDLKGLSEEKSRALFEMMAFEPGEAQKKPHLLNLGEVIVKRCGAVPLALRTLGTLLRGNDKSKWDLIAGISIGQLSDNQDIMSILKLSYRHLLSPLKNCFAFCALFPKDYVFEKKTLIDLWMAEGFVVPDIETQSLNELADEYFIQLLQRCFFQNVTRDRWGNISSFKMHDLMHDLALDVAGTESKVAKFQDGNFSDRTRHLSFDYHLTDSWEIPSNMIKAKQLRTILLPEQFRDGSVFKKAVLEKLISNFRCLRVLDLRNLGFSTLPKTIGKLIHLRYLNLSMNPIKEFPHTGTRLQNLQTLVLYRCLALRALPVDTRKLTNLRSLNIRGCGLLTNMPPRLGELSSLHELPYFIVKDSSASKFVPNLVSARLSDLNTLNHLKGSLKIKFLDDLEDPASEAKKASLDRKHGLTELHIQMGGKIYVDANLSDHDEALLEGLKPNENLKKLEINWYRGENLPAWAMTDSLCMTLPNLVEIGLLGCQRCRHVPSFSQLPLLRRLSLVQLKSVEYMERSLYGFQSPRSQSTKTFFPSLQELELGDMDNLIGWWEETKALDCNDPEELSHESSLQHPLAWSFYNLAKLRIHNCKNLASFPLSPNVEELFLKNVSKHLIVLKKMTSSTMSGEVGSSVIIPEHSLNLKILSIDKVEDLISLPEECLSNITSLEIQDAKLLNTSGLEEVFRSLSSLRCLKFTSCISLTAITNGLDNLTSLDRLVIQACQELDLSQNERLKDSKPWVSLKSLSSLHFYAIPKLIFLPDGLQHLAMLRSLDISCSCNFVALPEWISCFPSLEYIKLYYCPKLTRLPENISKLTALHELRIVDCPGLTKRCRGPSGVDWPKIQHIPLVIVKESCLDQ